ncbi:MAG: hypothetical protein PUF61_00370 [Spirochaetales bacterium]|nr:hypothetical protein [Spirochaetales bacterium]
MRKESTKYIKSILLAVLTAMLLVSCGGGGGGGGMVSFSNNSELHNGGDAGGWGGSGGGNNTSNSSVTGSLSSGAGTFTPPNDIDWSSIELTITVTSGGTTTTHTLANTETEAIAELLTSLKRGDVVEVTADITMVDDDPRTTSSGAVTIGVGDNHISLPTPYKFSCSTEMTENMYESYYDTLGLSAPTPSSTFSGEGFGISTINEIASKLPEATAPGFKFDHWITQDGQTYIPGVTRGDVVISPVFKPDYTCAYGDLLTDIVVTSQQDFNDLINTHAAQDFSGKTITLACDVSTSKSFSKAENMTDGFKGTFDGRKHTVTLNATSYTTTNIGNVAYYLSGLFLLNQGTITSVKISGTVNGSGGISGYSGGIVAYNKGSVEKCANTASVSGSSGSNGGIAGNNLSGGTIDQCYNTGTISSSDSFQPCAGGITGTNNGSISNCYNTGRINSGRAGGISGHIGANSANPSVINCYNAYGSSGFDALSYTATLPENITVNEFFYNAACNIIQAGTAPSFTPKTLAQTGDLVTNNPSIWELRPGATYPTLINTPE